MRAGTLRHRITITNPTIASQNSHGEDVITPVVIGSYWCRVEMLEGQELQVALQRWPLARYKITMRRQNGFTFTTKMYITWNGRRLDIQDVQDVGDSFRPDVTIYAKDYGG